MAPLIIPFFHPTFWVLYYQSQAIQLLEHMENNVKND
jgi:hypothetical protein